MVDEGGRLKNSAVANMAKTMHSLTYSFPSYIPKQHKGPSLFVVFTNISRYTEAENDIQIPGIRSSNLSSSLEFESLVRKFKIELVNHLSADLSESVDLEYLTRKVDQILPSQHFFAFKILNGDKM